MCFHAQQCAEKAIRGVLLGLGIVFPKTPNWAALCRLLPEDVQIAPPIEEQVQLTYYTNGPRYPDDFEEIKHELAGRLASVADTLYANATRWLDAHSLRQFSH